MIKFSTSKMLNFSTKIISFIWHPIFMPLYTVLCYFHFTTRYFLQQNQDFLNLYLLLVSIIIPLAFFGLMFYTKSFSGYQLSHPKERLFFSVIMAVVYLIIFQKIIHYHQFMELFPFFLGIFLGISALVIYNFFGQKPSIHAMAVSGSLTFLIMWSYYTQINILNYLAVFFIIASLILAARLYLNAHDFKDLFRGVFIGILMQCVSFYVIWLYF